MPSQVSNYKCPACTGPLHYDSHSGNMACDYCGSEFSVQEIEALYTDDNISAEEAFAAHNAAAQQQSEPTVDAEWQSSGETDDWGQEGEGLRAYSCPSCGAELICDETTAATSCPYCGNPTIVPGQFTGSLKPDLIIPFKLDKKAAKAALRKHFEGKKLLPKFFHEENHLDEIKGVYVPFWLFDADADADLTYNAQRVQTWSDSNYRYTKTSYYRLFRSGEIRFDNVPVDASEKMPDDVMESLEPFDLSAAVPFERAYLAGYLADRYDVEASASVGRANTRVKNSAQQAFDATVGGYVGVMPAGGAIRVRNGKAKYALFPVWLLNTTWKGKRYSFAMNGQSGKFVGDLPCDSGAYWKYRLLYGGVFAAASFAIALLAMTM